MRKTYDVRFMALTWVLLLVTSLCAAESPVGRTQLVGVLLDEMRGQREFAKVRAAEALLTHGHDEVVRQAFETELDTAQPAYRIGVWHIMARAAATAEARAGFVARIRAAFLDENGPDRLHAVESLAKLGAHRVEDRGALETYAATADETAAPYARWLLALGGDMAAEEALANGLSSANSLVRRRSAYALACLPAISPGSAALIAGRLDAEPVDSPARVYLAGAAMHGDPATKQRGLELLREYVRRGNAGEQFEAATRLGACGTSEDLPLLRLNLTSREPDVRIGAAEGTLHLLRRQPHRIGALDWTVIVLYLVGMLGVGVYYARKKQSREEYLLGGRTMRPWAVGLSYFATMFSTITYMSLPGEVIKHGPMVLGQIAGIPIAIALVGYFIIPYIMRLRVTSAHEILELRLGVSVRLLGSIFFLSMRLFWMAVILYTTTTKILVPVAGLDPSAGFWLAALLGIITVIYTSMGGFKAVVVTDVAQTVILFGGAVLAIVMISVHLGGLDWIPTRWDPGWQDPVFFYDPSVRMSFMGAVIALVTWHVCTAGSDQMAIQRYLSTRNAASARRMFSTALTTSGSVHVLLAFLGLALFAYFRARPEMMNAGQGIAANADQLFPQYVVFGMPAGITGLVVAGLLAAAMSSLSSGVSSGAAVITIDFIERFGGVGRDGGNSHTARLISWSIGGVVVLLSSVIGSVSGNLLEVTFKVVNLLTAPLFGLFFMAMFVPWARPLGTWLGAVVGVTVAVLINYGGRFPTPLAQVGFILAMPVSLAAQVVAGMLLSLIPIGTPAPLLRRIDDKP